MARIVVVGDLMTDTVAHAALPLAKGSDTPATVSMHGGGSGANIAAWLAADGAEVAFVGRRGADIAGRNRDMELMGYGVDARLVMDPDRPTGTCVVMVTHKGEHTMLSDPGANAALLPDDLPKDLFAPGSHLHMSGYTLLNEGSRAAALAAFQHAGRAGMTISVDGASAAPLERVGAEPLPGDDQRGNSADRERRPGRGADRPGRPRVGGAGAHRLVPAGRGEAGAGRRAVTRTAGQIRSGCRSSRWRRSLTAPAAGDAFCAGFLPAWLDKKPPMEALASGCRLAARALGLVGARPGALTRGPARPGSAGPHFEALFSLQGRAALVTGGSSGIGRAIAARAGAGRRQRGHAGPRPAALAETVAELRAAAAAPPGCRLISADRGGAGRAERRPRRCSASPTSWSTAPGPTRGRRSAS